MKPDRVTVVGRSGRSVRRQRGAATLVVVMVLFFVMSMVATYTSRNLIFEQRTSANQYRSTQALEAADAGLQWALGLLNGGRIDADCRPSTDPANTTFRQRYLSIDGASGAITPLPAGAPGTLRPSCVFDGANWQCSCPAAGAPTVSAPSGPGVFPAFRVRFMPDTVTGRPSLVRIEVNSCTRYDELCLNFPPQGADNEGRASVSALLALKGAVSTEPIAALTAHGTVGGTALVAANTNPKGSGITAHAGGNVTLTPTQLLTIPGSPAAQSFVQNDALLQFAAFPAADRPDAMFAATMGMTRTMYRDQPAAVQLACGGTCSAAQVRTAVADNPGRPIWVAGDLNLDSAGDIGSAADPVAVVVTGNLQFTTPVNVYGVVYVQAADWDVGAGAGQVNGAAIAEGNVGGAGALTVAHDATLVTRVRHRSGSFVVVPGSWKDFP